ncbi:hypothetical protein HAX54_016134 [Datura stramonium]|uniref:Small EDRK-rich factor-like N-terminal domain-containing protein n=1 Tax=Datura stramonium TaxID=4076 RepID=A0ABS8S0B6_DATST|nr:hypothetical protein [Datura stramonium]
MGGIFEEYLDVYGDRDRERAQARGNHKPRTPKNDGLTPEQRRERDANALQEKAKKKAAQAAGGVNIDKSESQRIKKK